MTAKEVWYVWDGESSISGNATRYIDRNGHHHIPRFTIPFKHSGFGAGGEIVAYTLGEVRERVDCEDCVGTGCAADLDGGEVVFYLDEKCPDCQGRGYIWRMRVAS